MPGVLKITTGALTAAEDLCGGLVSQIGGVHVQAMSVTSSPRTMQRNDAVWAAMPGD